MLRTLSAILGAALVLAAGAVPASAEPVKMAIGYATATDFLPVFVAKDKGFFAKHNIDADPQRIQVVTHIPAALVAGSLQVGMTTAPLLLQATDGGLDLVIIAGAARMVKSNPTISLLARKGLTIGKAADLKGRKIGVPGINSVMDVFLKKWLLNNQVNPKDVTIIEAPLPQMADLLKAGTLDAVAVVEPVRTRIVAGDIGSIAAEFLSDVDPDVLVSAWITTGDWAKKNPAAIQDFREAVDEGLAFIRANPDAAREIEKKYLGFNSPKFPTFENKARPQDLAIFAQIGKELGLLRNPVDPAKLVLK